MTTNLKETVKGIVLRKTCSVKPDGDSTESKTITVEMNYDGLTLEDVFTKALSSDIIKWQGSARKIYDTLTDKGTVKVDAKSPGSKPEVDPVTAMIQLAKDAGMTVEQYLMAELAKRS